MSGYIGPLPVPQGIQRKQSFTATASQTTFNTNGYTDGDFINVYLNGVRLINGTDYTATNGSDIVLTTGASASDVLDFETFQTFQLVDQQFENVTLKNPTHEDTDGGRESAVSFKGEQSGGEISTLAEIQASHDGTSDDQKGDLIFKTNDGSDNDAPTEAFRVDSSQNLLVGKTTTSTADQGIQINPAGRIESTSDGGEALRLNRKTSDGVIIQVRKDNNTIGNIGVHNTSLVVGKGDTGLKFNADVDSVYPWDIASNNTRDDAIDLGYPTHRFQDLYLSGGAYLGGTGASNKLEDYEEGTWTPALSNHNGSTSGQTIAGRYTKVGRMCHAYGVITQGSGTVSGNLTLTGFPFNAAGTFGDVSCNSSNSSPNIPISNARVVAGASGFVLKDTDGDTISSGSGDINICFSAVYEV